MNKHELFTKQQIMRKIDVKHITWMAAGAKQENYQFFEKENKWVLWKIMKWIFEDLVV